MAPNRKRQATTPAEREAKKMRIEQHKKELLTTLGKRKEIEMISKNLVELNHYLDIG